VAAGRSVVGFLDEGEAMVTGRDAEARAGVVEADGEELGDWVEGVALVKVVTCGAGVAETGNDRGEVGVGGVEAGNVLGKGGVKGNCMDGRVEKHNRRGCGKVGAAAKGVGLVVAAGDTDEGEVEGGQELDPTGLAAGQVTLGEEVGQGSVVGGNLEGEEEVMLPDAQAPDNGEGLALLGLVVLLGRGKSEASVTTRKGRAKSGMARTGAVRSWFLMLLKASSVAEDQVKRAFFLVRASRGMAEILMSLRWRRKKLANPRKPRTSRTELGRGQSLTVAILAGSGAMVPLERRHPRKETEEAPMKLLAGLQ
jgi:hypothetical protein